MLLGTVVSVALAPPVDDPHTFVNESDFQVTFAIPSTLSIKLDHPFANTAELSKLALYRQDYRCHPSHHEFMPVPKQSCSHASQILLCTLLI
jgi:hypothetical protein